MKILGNIHVRHITRIQQSFNGSTALNDEATIDKNKVKNGEKFQIGPQNAQYSKRKTIDLHITVIIAF